MLLQNGILDNMITHATYDSNSPLPYHGASSIATQIDSYINQQEWLPIPGVKRRPRQSRDDLRRTKCTARYRQQMIHGPISAKQLREAFGITTQAVKLKMREYLKLGYVKYNRETDKYEWIKNATS